MEAENGSTIKMNFKTNGLYRVSNKNNFTILPDQETIIGSKNDYKTLQTENIKDNEDPLIIDQTGDIINSLIFNKLLNVLVVCYFEGYAIQYKKDSEGVWKTQFKYENLELGNIRTIETSKKLAIISGSEFKFRLIDLEKLKMVGPCYTTSVKFICSLNLCKLSSNQIILEVDGCSRDYSDEKTDLFDGTAIFSESTQ